MNFGFKYALVVFTLSLAVVSYASGSGEGKLQIEKVGQADYGYYLVNGFKYLLEASDEGIIFYRDGNGFKEPPLNILAALYRVRQEQKENGVPLSKSREQFLRNPRYHQLFVAGGEDRASHKVIDGVVYESNGNALHKIQTVEGGRLVALDSLTYNGVKYQHYRSLNPKTLAGLTKAYGDGDAYAAIRNHPSNKADLDWASASKLSVAAPTHSLQSNAPTIAGKVHAATTSASPVARAAKPAFPYWAKSKDCQFRYPSLVEKFPDPKVVEAPAEWMTDEYLELSRAVDRQEIEIKRMESCGVSEEDETHEGELAYRKASALHRYWAHRTHNDDGSARRLGPEENKAYEAFLATFEEMILANRYTKLYAEFRDDKVRRYDEKHPDLKTRNYFRSGPGGTLIMSVGRNIDDTAKEEAALEEQAAREVIQEFKDDRIAYLETMNRLVELARIPSKANAVGLKYPKLPLLIMQMAASESKSSPTTFLKLPSLQFGKGQGSNSKM